MRIRILIALALCALVAIPALADARMGKREIRRHDKRAIKEIRRVAARVESCFGDTSDYSLCNSYEELGGGDIRIGTGKGEVQILASPGYYQLDIRSHSRNRFYWSRHAGDSFTRTCRRAGRGRCPRNGLW